MNKTLSMSYRYDIRNNVDYDLPSFVHNSDLDALSFELLECVQFGSPPLLPPSKYYLTPLYKEKVTHCRTKSVFVYDVQNVWRTPYIKTAYDSRSGNKIDRSSAILSEDLVREIVANVCGDKRSCDTPNRRTQKPRCAFVPKQGRNWFNSKFSFDKRRKQAFPMLTSRRWNGGSSSRRTEQHILPTENRNDDISRSSTGDKGLPYDRNFFNFDTDYMVSPLNSPCSITPPPTESDPETHIIDGINIPVFMAKPCIDPDQMLNDCEPKTSSTCLLDSLSDFDLQEQILIEDRHQGLQQNDDLIPIDQYSERMQYKLITDITGKDEKSAVLGIVNCAQPSPPVETEVQNVEITPGGQDLTIEGIKFSLPCGSTILAVTNDTTDTLNDTFNSDVEPFDSVFFDNDDLIREEEDSKLDQHLLDVSFPIHGISSINDLATAIALDEMANKMTKTTPEGEIKSSCMITSNTKSSDGDEWEDLEENNFEGFEMQEDCSTDEPMSKSAPVIEARELDALIEEYEASEVENLQQDKFLIEGKTFERVSSAISNESSIKDVARSSEPAPSTSSSEVKKSKEIRKKSSLSLIERHNRMKLRQMKTHQKIRDSIPIEIIEKIKASGQRSCTKILTEALMPKLRRKKATKQNRIKKTNSKKKNLKKNRSSPVKTNKMEILPVVVLVPSDHDYCKSPVKKQIKMEREEMPEITEPVFNKIPEYCQLVVKTEIKQEPFSEEPFKKDSGVDSGNVSDSSLFEAEERRKGTAPVVVLQIDPSNIKKEVEEEVVIVEDENVYSRLPDYVTDIGNVKPKEIVDIKEEPTSDDCTEYIKEESDVQDFSCASLMEEPKKKKKLNLSEYRMRKKNSTDNSRCNSPFYGDDKSHSSGGLINLTEDKEEGEIKEEIPTNNIPKADTIQVEIKPRQTCEPVTKVIKSSANAGKKEKSPNAKYSKRSHKKPIVSPAKSSVSVIEIDLEKEEEEKEREQKIKAKLGFIGKMPSTSLGHCLLYSKKKNLIDSNESKKCQSSSKRSSRKHRFSSSRSRSRSRSYSSKSSSRYRKSRGSKHSSHRKSRRRSSRSRSRGRSKSKSSITSVRSSSSSNSSRSRSYSNKSYRSKSKSSSRSRSSRRKYRYKRHSRSRERSRRRSGSRSSINWGSRSRYGSPSYDQYYRYSSVGYYSYVPSDYPVCHKIPKEFDREEERRIIYVGGIEDGTTRKELRHRFERYGQIADISVHFRERGDNYGFITFKHKENAYDAMEHGNDDSSLPWYNLCFGGRRNFCKEDYADLDAHDDKEGFFNSASNMDYDTLLRTTLQLRR